MEKMLKFKDILKAELENRAYAMTPLDKDQISFYSSNNCRKRGLAYNHFYISGNTDIFPLYYNMRFLDHYTDNDQDLFNNSILFSCGYIENETLIEVLLTEYEIIDMIEKHSESLLFDPELTPYLRAIFIYDRFAFNLILGRYEDNNIRVAITRKRYWICFNELSNRVNALIIRLHYSGQSYEEIANNSHIRTSVDDVKATIEAIEKMIIMLHDGPENYPNAIEKLHLSDNTIFFLKEVGIFTTDTLEKVIDEDKLTVIRGIGESRKKDIIKALEEFKNNKEG